MDGELLAEYAANGATASPQKEYGYRSGELLITVEAGISGGGGGAQNVTWQNAVGVSVSGNSITKTAANSWGNAGAASQQAITSGDGYVEFSAGTSGDSMVGLSNGDPDQSYNIDFAIHVDLGNASIWEDGVWKTNVGAYASSDRFRVAVEGGVVKYRKNGTLLYTSAVSPTYPLLFDSSLYLNGSTVNDAVIHGSLSSQGGTSAQINWLVTDHLGTPRIIADQTGSLAGINRHDYLPFGEELLAGTGGRTTAKGYSGNAVRQKFTSKERDSETGLDYFSARYNSSTQGRFTSVDPVFSGSYVAGPQYWNRYTYALNNPLSVVDRNGKWPTWIHEMIIDQAFPGLSDEERQFIKYGSWYVDLMGTDFGGTLRETNANEHAMRTSTQSYVEAVMGYQNFIDSKNAQAAALPDATVNGVNRSLMAFGEATHPLSDNTSPTHSPFQVYRGTNFPVAGDPLSIMLFGAWCIDMQSHKGGESRINPRELMAATQALQENYRKVYPHKFQRAVTRRSPMAFLDVFPAYYVPSWHNVLAVVTVYADGSMEARGRNLQFHPTRSR